MKTLIKSPRIGETKTQWERKATVLWQSLFSRRPSTKWEDGHLTIDFFDIVPCDYEETHKSILGSIELTIQGYEVLGWKTTGGSYWEQPDVDSYHIGYAKSPEVALVMVAQEIINYSLDAFVENESMDRVIKEQNKYYDDEEAFQKKKFFPEL